MQDNARLIAVLTRPLEDLGGMQARYQPLSLSERAASALADAEPALSAAETVLNSFSDTQAATVFSTIRKNAALMGKIRPSEAKSALVDSKMDFIATTRHKLAAWRRTLERLSTGEGVEHNKIAAESPIAMAIAGASGIGPYLSIIQLALSECGKREPAQAEQYTKQQAAIRRCATILGDCEHASGLWGL